MAQHAHAHVTSNCAGAAMIERNIQPTGEVPVTKLEVASAPDAGNAPSTPEPDADRVTRRGGTEAPRGHKIFSGARAEEYQEVIKPVELTHNSNTSWRVRASTTSHMTPDDEAPRTPTTLAPSGADPSIIAPGANTNTARNELPDKRATELFVLDGARPLDPATFPNPPRAGSIQLPTTIANISWMFDHYGITAQYDVIKKRLRLIVPGLSSTPENLENVALAHIVSLAALNGMSTGLVPNFVDAIGDRHQYNPVVEWIESRPWDGIDRLPQFYATLTQRGDFPEDLKQTLLRRWLLSAVAAALKPSGFRSRGVLTLQGPQSIGKTAWVNASVSDQVLREQVVRLDHHLDAGNKDSLLTAIGHWIVEIGELDSSFRKDIARLKGFLTSDRDKVRRPYGRTDSEYPRRTVFCATVNDPNFLVDTTGNSRFWTIPVVNVNYAHGIDMQQLFAQVAEEFRKGEQWWLTQAEEQALELHNRSHRAISAIQERVLDALDLARRDQQNLPSMSCAQVLQAIGVERPRNSECKECACVLREYIGEPKRIHGFNKWKVPLKSNTDFPSMSPSSRSDDDF